MKKIKLIQTGGTIAMDHRNKTPELNLLNWVLPAQLTRPFNPDFSPRNLVVGKAKVKLRSKAY